MGISTGESKGLTGKSVLIASVSGGVSGALEILFTYPFEFAKTQVQLEPKKYHGKPFWICWSETYREFGGFPRGLTALYRGLPTLILFGVPRNATRFTGFEFAKQKLNENFHLSTIPTNIIAGFCGGVSEAVLVTTFQETMKVRIIHDRLSGQPRFRNTFHGVSTIFKEQGFSGIYKGLTPTVLRQGSNQMIRFPVYFYLKTFFLGDPRGDFSKNGVILGNLQAMFAGAIAGSASVLGNTPIDVIKTKMQGLDAHRYTGAMDCIKKTWAEDGFKGFYKGTGARLGRVSLDVALTFFFVEKVTKIITALL